MAKDIKEVFDLLSEEELKRAAAQGKLVWRDKKVFLDPFVKVRLVYAVQTAGESYAVRGKLLLSNREEEIGKDDIFFSSGVLQHQTFRFWEEEYDEKWIAQAKGGALLFARRELKEFIDACQGDPMAPQIQWNCPIPRWKPEPLPVLQLIDRTGAFANLWMDYGPWGKEEMHVEGRLSTPEELFWEKDLLETDFIKKRVGATHYYCPMDKVVKSLTFLLDLGWTLLDHQGKKIMRQGAADWKAEVRSDALLLKGKIAYGAHIVEAKDVLGTFNRREKFVDLSPGEVGLLEMPEQWTVLAGEEITAEGIMVRRHHLGLVEDIVPLPSEYQPAKWEEIIPGNPFKGQLFDYQLHGLRWLSYLFHSRFSGLLADEMGLGKTLQVIAWLSTVDFTHPVLIIMPVSLLFHWRKEFEKFLPGIPIYCHRGPDRLQKVDELNYQKVILTSYAQLREDRLLFEGADYAAVILDEAQAIKNPDTQAAQIACRLRAPFKLALTGTPVENRYDDLWSLFRFLMPELLGERTENVVIERVRKKIRPFLLRRTKSSVALQLPEKHEQVIWVQWSEEQRDFYEQYLREKKTALVQKIHAQGLSSKRMEVLELILRLRQICCHPRLVAGDYEGESAKFTAVCSDLEEIVASGSKVLLYSQFTSVLTLFKTWVREKGWRYAYLDGQTQEREQAIEAFQTDPDIPIFLMSLRAGGVGLNLQAADYVFLYDPWWNGAAEQQAIDRAHRFGRKNRVIARKYLMAESIEEKILKLQGHKSVLAENLLEIGEEAIPTSLEELYALLES